jgi:hypothetical protein
VRKLKFLSLVILIASTFFLFVGCSKSNNNNSASTKDSVLYSAWQPFSMTFEGIDNNSDSIYDQTTIAAAITQNVLDKGTVLVYISNGSGSYADATNAGFSVVLGVGQIYISTYGSVPSNFTWRYMVIPGNIATTSTSGSVQTYTPSQLKTMSYSAVSGILGISEAKKLTP